MQWPVVLFQMIGVYRSSLQTVPYERCRDFAINSTATHLPHTGLSPREKKNYTKRLQFGKRLILQDSGLLHCNRNPIKSEVQLGYTNQRIYGFVNLAQHTENMRFLMITDNSRTHLKRKRRSKNFGHFFHNFDPYVLIRLLFKN